MTPINQLVTSKQKLVSTSNELTSLQIRERALGLAQGLTSTVAPDDMTAWYCKAYKLLGHAKYEQIVKAARKENSKRLFGYLLKEEMKLVK